MTRTRGPGSVGPVDSSRAGPTRSREPGSQGGSPYRVTSTAPLVETPFPRLRSVVDTNLTAMIRMIQEVFPIMADQGQGRIVNVGSVVGVLPVPFTAVCCATKAGVHMLSEVLRLELAPFGIEVTAVQPAAVRSQIDERGAEGMEAFERPESRYHFLLDSIRKRAEAPKSVSAERFAVTTADAILASKLPRTVYGGRESTMLQLAARLPGRLREALTRSQFGLPATRISNRVR